METGEGRRDRAQIGNVTFHFMREDHRIEMRERMLGMLGVLGMLICWGCVGTNGERNPRREMGRTAFFHVYIF